MRKSNKILKFLDENIILIILVGTFVVSKTQIDIFEEVEKDILLNKYNLQNSIYRE
ncbi:TPA: hypothetical protein P1K40_000313 [Clostridioides difficile]|nr:hypothetical protein [Clostridioides difficile]